MHMDSAFVAYIQAIYINFDALSYKNINMLILC